MDLKLNVNFLVYFTSLLCLLIPKLLLRQKIFSYFMIQKRYFFKDCIAKITKYVFGVQFPLATEEKQ